jgi:phenylacetate-CoA ligase
MSFAEKARSRIFWSIDFLKAARIREHYMEIRQILENPGSPEMIMLKESHLNRILSHATETTRFYSNYRDFNSINDFPVINKSEIREHSIEFLARDFIGKKLHKVTTSGSTGTPLSVFQDEIKRRRHIAENIYFSEQAGIALGSRLYYLRVWNEINRKSFVKRHLQNIIMQDAADLTDHKLELFISRLERDSSGSAVLAFASTLEVMAQFIERNQRKSNAHVSCFIAISETLSDGARNILQEAFGCPVISRYSNMENGFLAQQCGDKCGEYHINTSGFYVELLDPDRDENVGSGLTGRIVVTDLFNFAMPLIRYDTGDMAVFSDQSSCGKLGPVFTSIEGRRVDFIYSTDGGLLSPHVITNTMWRYSSLIKQFQFIQNSRRNYTIRLNSVSNVFVRERELVSDLKHYLGNDAIITTEFVNEIPTLASGKRKKIINNFDGIDH